MSRRARYSVRGFSLIELMVSITIGLIILAAVGGLFVTSKTTYTTQDGLARLQENARFAMHFLMKDLRLAGYYGCVDEINSETVHSTLNNPGNFSYNTQVPLEGLDGAASTPKWWPSGEAASLPTTSPSGSDAVTLRFADPSGAESITKEMPNESAELDVSDVSGFSVGDIIVVTDCASSDAMQITAVQTSSLKLQHNGGTTQTPGNSSQKLSKAYSPPGGKIMKFVTRRYYIDKGASGNPALFRDTNGGASEELVDGIERIKISFGKDTNGDNMPDRYLKAGDATLKTADDWAAVKSIRIGILVRTPTQEAGDLDSETYDIDDDGVNDYTAPGDRYRRRVFAGTVLLRNL